MPTGCFISTGRSLDQAVERVRLAESLGYHSVYVTHIAGRESLTVLTVYATATERIRIGTGVVPIYTRTPATMAQTAATIDELSGGRLDLGLGVSHRPVVEGWHGQTIDKPVTEMREYVRIVRAILRGEDPPPGDKWQTVVPPGRARAAARAADLRRRAVAEHAAPGRRARRRRDALAVQRQLRPRRGAARACARAARRRASRSTASTSSPPCRAP